MRQRCSTLGAALLAVCLAFLLLPDPTASAAAPPVPTVAAGYAWGSNDHGELAAGSTSTLREPTPVVLPAGVTAVTLGRNQALAVVGGKVLAWGDGAGGRPVTFPAGVVISTVATDEGHSLALATDGRVFAWGDNSAGQLGDGSTTRRSAPVRIRFPGDPVISSVGTGRNHSLAVTRDGRVFAWGAGDLGQLGDGLGVDHRTPTAVPLPAGLRAAKVAAGISHSVLLTTGDAVLTWGTTDAARQVTPTRLGLTESAVDIAAGDHHGLALLAGGAVIGWGANDFGQLGTGATGGSSSPVTVALPTGTKVGHLSAAGNHAIALTQDGQQVFTWGDAARSIPKVVRLPAGGPLLSVSAGWSGFLVVPQLGPVARLTLSPPMAAVPTGGRIAYTARGYDRSGHFLGPLSAGVQLTMAGGRCAGLVCTAGDGGEQTVTAVAGGVHAVAQVYVNGPAATTTPTTSRTSTSPPRPTSSRTTTGTTTSTTTGSTTTGSTTTSGSTLPATGVGRHTPALGWTGLLLVVLGSAALLLTRRPSGRHS